MARLVGRKLRVYLNGRELKSVLAVEDRHSMNAATEVTLVIYPSSVFVDTDKREIDIGCEWGEERQKDAP